MDLHSCDSCGVLLDKDKLHYPTDEEIWHEDGHAIPTKTVYDSVCGQQPAVPCPVCKELIPR